MKKLLICLTVAAFATMTSLQVGAQCAQQKASCPMQAKTCEKASTCEKAKTCEQAKTCDQVKSCCPASAAAGQCKASGKVAKRNAAQVKGATLLVTR